MLILTRKSGESIVIGNNITINIVSIEGKNVRIGIKAPEEISIYRAELYNKIVKENLQSSSLTTEKFDSIMEAIKKNDKV